MAMCADNLTILHDTLAPRRQGWRAQRTVDWRGCKLRATIYQDAYLNQSDYYLEIFSPDGLNWNRVYTEDSSTYYSVLPSSSWDTVRPSHNGGEHDLGLLFDRLLAYGQDLLEGIA